MEDAKKTKSIRNIEEKMEGAGDDPMKYQIFEKARNFKTSWIELGQAMYTVWKDKLYKEWGYNEFENFTAKELGIRKETALKLLRSYSFLEKEEPRYIKKEYNDEAPVNSIPNYEAVDVLRQAANKDLGQEEYARVRKYVLEKGKDAKEVKKDITELIKKNAELEPEEAIEKKRSAAVRRFIGLLRALRNEIVSSKALSQNTLKQADLLIEKLESEMSHQEI